MAPVALLASHYRHVFADRVDANTLHSVFRIPVKEDDAHNINFSLSRYDLIVIDEASMISRPTFNKIASTLSAIPKRPVVVIAGDKVQQQPIGNRDGRVVQLVSILNDGTLQKNTITYVLYRQFRCIDAAYGAFLDYLRHWQPTQEFLDHVQDGRVVEGALPITDYELWTAIVEETSAIVLTVSREGADRINRVVLNRLFEDAAPISNVPCQGRFCTFPVFAGMRVVITQNRDKDVRFVNGQRAVVEKAQNNTILRLQNEKLLFAHPVSSINDQGVHQVTYPFRPGYGLTICKSQGGTLPKVLLWLDSPVVPKGTAYVGLSRVRKLEDIRFVTRMLRAQITPVPLQ